MEHVITITLKKMYIFMTFDYYYLKYYEYLTANNFVYLHSQNIAKIFMVGKTPKRKINLRVPTHGGGSQMSYNFQVYY